MSVTPARERFYHNLSHVKGLIKEAIAHCDKSIDTSILNGDVVELAFVYIEALDRQELLDGFIERTNGLWENVADEKVKEPGLIFRSVMSTFEKLEKGRADEIMHIVETDMVPTELRERIWTAMRSLVKISIRHLYECQAGKCKDGKAGKEAGWPNSGLDIARLVGMFNIKV